MNRVLHAERGNQEADQVAGAGAREYESEKPGIRKQGDTMRKQYNIHSARQTLTDA